MVLSHNNSAFCPRAPTIPKLMKPLFLLLLLAPLLLLSPTSWAAEIIAHRGASYDAPENTLAALRLGWEQGADAGELDIHLSRDGQIVLMHDASTKRTAGVDKTVAEQTLEELRALDAGAWKAPKWAGEKVPTLAEALATIPEGKRMFVEIKCGPEVLPELARVIAASGKGARQIPIIGFNLETMRLAKALLPAHEVSWLASHKKGKDGNFPTPEELIVQAQGAGLDGLDLDFRFPIDAAFAAQVKAAGLKLYAWTVDDATAAKSLVAVGVEGITTNRPAWLREQMNAGG
jgi:glycerophosphoryl diester phosphodiesterase